MDWCANALRVVWVFCWNSSQSNMTCHRLFLVDCDFIIVWHAIWSKPSTLAGVCQTWLDIFNHKWSPDHSCFWCLWKQGIHKADRATHKSWEVHIHGVICSMLPLHPKLHFTQIYTARKKQRLVSKRMHNGGHLCRLGCYQQMPIDWFTAHSPHYITVEEADELPVVVMGTENDLLVMLTSLGPSSGTKTYIIMKCCRNLEIVLRDSDIVTSFHRRLWHGQLAIIWQGKRNPLNMVTQERERWQYLRNRYTLCVFPLSLLKKLWSKCGHSGHLMGCHLGFWVLAENILIMFQVDFSCLKTYAWIPYLSL